MQEGRVFTNARIYTMGEAVDRPEEAMFVVGGEIAAVGSQEEIRCAAADYPGHVEVVDLGGAVVVPGLVDSHTHFAAYCEMGLGADLTRTQSRDEALQCVSEVVRGCSAGEWVRGWGWNKNLWEDDSFPDRYELDRVAPDNPVALTSKDGHAMWVNTLALAEAGIDADTPDPAGGRILSADDCRLCGILLETAMDLVRKVMPPVPVRDMKEVLLRGQAEAHSLGLTGLITCEGPEALRAFAELNREGKLSLRVRSTLPDDSLSAARSTGLTAGMGDDFLRLFAVKVLVDGALGAQTAHLSFPYRGREDDYRGVPIYTEEELVGIVRTCRDLGFPVAIHAIGDAANRTVLDVLERMPPPAGMRDRIEHAQLLKPEDIPRFADLGVVASVQPAHAVADRDLVDRYWGERGKYAYAFRSLACAGTTLAFGSDLPVDVLDPLVGMRAAVCRTDDNRAPWYPEECISASQAVRAYTRGSAYGVGEESVRGALLPSMLADFSVFSDDIMRHPPGTSCRCLMTVVGGDVVYDRGDSVG